MKTTTDTLIQPLVSAVTQIDKAQKDYAEFLPKLRAAQAEVDSFLNVPRGNVSDLNHRIELSQRRGRPTEGEMPAFNLARQAEGDHMAEAATLAKEVNEAESAVKIALQKPLAVLLERIQQRRSELVTSVVKFLRPHVGYESEAQAIAEQLLTVKTLDSAAYQLKTASPLVKARTVISDWHKYDAKN